MGRRRNKILLWPLYLGYEAFFIFNIANKWYVFAGTGPTIELRNCMGRAY